MATPTSIGAWQNVSLTGVDAIDSLIGGTRWSSHTLTFSFPGGGSSWSTSESTGYGGFASGNEPWSERFEGIADSDKSAVRTALQSWSAVADLTFNEVADNETVVGDMRFAYTVTADTADAQAWAYFPGETVRAGDVWFNAEGTSYEYAWDLGTYEYQTVVHEIGHGLGLKHPFEDPGAIDPSLDSRSFTVMSYSARAGDQNTYFSYEPTTPMVLDVAAIQHLYGARTGYNAGNTNYVFTSGGDYHRTIWDGGGTDTITYQSALGGEIDLNQGVGGGSMLGKPVYVQNASGTNMEAVYNIWIAYDTVIENAVGGSGADKIIGNSVANSLKGGLGNDTISGAGGSDTLNGGAGNDAMNGGAGNDTYVVDATGDTIAETATSTSQIDTVSSSITWSLGANLENLVLTGSALVNATGNTLANTLTGNSAANQLTGGSGNDTLSGASGNDRLNAGSGDDTLTGGGGDDTLGGSGGNDTLAGNAGSDRVTGGSGADWFMLNSKVGSDTFTDFLSGTDDVRVSMAGIKVGDGDVSLEGAVVRGAAGGFSAAAELVIFTANVASLSASSAAAAIGSATSAYAVGRSALFAVDTGASSALYLFTAADANASVSASELTLLATLSGTASTVASDYAFTT